MRKHTDKTKKKIAKTLKGKYIGKKNGNYKHGKYCNPHYCIDCNKELNKKNPNSKRCRKCANKKHGLDMRINNKGKNNPNYKHGLSKNRTKYRKFRRKTDLNYRIRNSLRKRIKRALKYAKKLRTTQIYIGCSIAFLKKYFEKQFKQGMSWKNYGHGKDKWCIDHIKPCCQFDLTKLSEQLKCFNYKNLRPLWFLDNIKRKRR